LGFVPILKCRWNKAPINCLQNFPDTLEMSKILRFATVKILTVLLLGQVAWATPQTTSSTQEAEPSSKTTFGPEWEFTTRQLYYSKDAEKLYELQKAFIDKLYYICLSRGDCSVERNNPKSSDYGKVTYSDGWWFQVTLDMGTIEIISRPTTLSVFKKIKRRIDNHIFGVAQSLGLKTNSESFGGGHIHIGIESSGLGSDPVLFRNFIVDFFNHDEMASGILNDDDENALPFSRLPEEAKAYIRQSIKEFDDSPKSKEDLKALIENINLAYKEFTAGDRYHALNLLHADTVEIRSLRMQRNMDDFLKLLHLFQSRIDYLKTFEDKLIPLDELKANNKPANHLQRFHRYVTESKLKWGEYKTFLNDSYLHSAKKMKLEDCIAAGIEKN